MKKRSKKGFTLVELVVVIAILAILAAIAIPQLLGFQERAREQADKQTMAQVRNAIALLHANGEIGGTGQITIAPPATPPGDGTWTVPATITGTANTETAIELMTGNIQLQGKKTIKITLGTNGSVTQVLE